ncbi:MAG TPA: VOC family protein [Thermoleophilaceae bacterium]|nr:VOC family protein [Thermoleophilaceae bacterium]
MPLAPAARPGAVHLTVTDLDRSIGFYEDALGLALQRREDSSAAMGAGGVDLVVLAQDPRARPAGRHAGLYHFALLHPSREELASALQRLAITRTPIQGASDHGVSEAIYLPDPDLNGIELYADRPRGRWPAPGAGARVGMFTKPLDLQGLVSVAPEPEPPARADPGLTMGHVHLHVGDMARALEFYRDVIGFESMAELPGAAFVSAGGYHHHLGLNTWRGEGVPPAPPDAVGLRHWTLVLDGDEELERVRGRLKDAAVPSEERPEGLLARDPSGTAVLLTAAP